MKFYLVISLFIIVNACDSNSYELNTKPQQILKCVVKQKEVHRSNVISPLEKYYTSKGLVDINLLDTSINVILAYSTSQNFLNKPLYNGLKKCYLPCEVAIKLCNAHYYLKQHNTLYNIVVFDATRPLSIQKQMWDEFEMPFKEKINYLAYPSSISLHNYGAAVDVGIIDNDSMLLDMGTVFDSFEKLSQPKFENQFYKQGLLTKEALNNRLLLRSIMLKAGFTSITSEWWHFNATNKTTAALKYELIN